MAPKPAGTARLPLTRANNPSRTSSPISSRQCTHQAEAPTTTGRSPRGSDHPGAITAAHQPTRIGKQPHPRIYHVEALASFFGIAVTYFSDDDAAANIADQISQTTVSHDTETHRSAERVVELNPRDRNTITNLIESCAPTTNSPRLTRRRRKPSANAGA